MDLLKIAVFLGGLITGWITTKIGRFLFRGIRIRLIEKRKKHWIQTVQIQRLEEKITMDDGRTLQGYIYSSDTTSDTAPSILFFHGLGGFAQDFNFEVFLSSLCLAGFRVFAYDFRASGASRLPNEPHILHTLHDKFVQRVYKDVPQAFEWMYSHQGVDRNKIFVIGASFGATMVLSKLLHESRIQKIIAICAPYDSRIMFERNFKKGNFVKRLLYKSIVRHIKDEEAFLDAFHQNSPVNYITHDYSYINRVFLAHCKDDDIVRFETHFVPNKAKMNLPDDQCLVFENGGHEFTENKAPLLSRILYWLQK